ncbi:MAG: DUF4347 domain-containing protein, partial [Pseudomonadota bacterium]
MRLVFINGDVDDIDTLLSDLQLQRQQGRDLHIHVLDADVDGIDQISDVLARFSHVSQIHILSHGSDGGVQVGSTWLTSNHANVLEAKLLLWQTHLSPDSSLLFYGCDLAASTDGLSLLNALARITGAQVFASDDDTGHTSLNADWDLEFHTGDGFYESLLSEVAQAAWFNELAAPVLGDGSLANINEDTPPYPGDTVANIFSGQFSSSDGSNFAGIAIAADTTTTEGAWQYSTDGGGGWNAIGAVTHDDALLLGTASMLRFVPAANVNGAIPDLTIYAIDDSAGVFVHGSTVDVKNRGGSTPYSLDSATIVSNIFSHNDAPTLDDGTLGDILINSTSPPGATVTNIFAGQFNDVDTGSSFGGVAIAAVNTFIPDRGDWQYSTDSGSNWFTIGGVSTSAALMLDTNAMLRFVPAAGYVGAIPALTLYGVDNFGGPYTSGATTVTEDVSNRGGSWSYALDAATVNSAVLGEFTAKDDDLGSVLSGDNLGFVAATLTANDVYEGPDAPTVLRTTTPSIGNIAITGANYTYGAAAGATGVATFQYDAMDGSPDLISQWRLTSDGADDAKWYNGTVTSDSAPGTLVFDGDDYVEIPNISYPSEFTLTFDFRVNDLDDGNEMVLFSQGEWQTSNYLGIWINDKDESPDRSLIAEIYDSTETDFGATRFEFDVSGFESDGLWHNFAITVGQGTGHSVYIDGNLEFSSSRADGPFTPTGPAYFGMELNGGSPDYHLQYHEIKDARLYNGFDLPAIQANELNEFSTGSVSVTVRNEQSLDTNNTVEVFEDQTVPITSADLLTTDIEDGPAALTYEIVTDASYGKLLLNGLELNRWDTFTQQDINDGNVAFRHDGNETATGDTIALNVDDGAGLGSVFSFSVTLKPVNDAPTMGDATLDAANEDDADPPGETVGTLFNGVFSDVDGSMSGVAITADASSAEGGWQYSTDNGVNWYDIGAVDTVAALTLDVTGKLRFEPAGDFFGPVPELTVRAIDDSYAGAYTFGATKGYADVSTNGGVTPYANTTSALGSTITPVGPADLSSGITLNTDGGNDAYLLANDGGALLGGLSAFTVEAQFELESATDYSSLFSYNAPVGEQLKLLINDNGEIRVGLLGVDFNTDPIPKLVDGEKHSVAASWDAVDGYLRIYADGELVKTEPGYQVGQSIPGGGSLVMGLEQDGAAGNFETNEVFTGTLYDMRVWNEARTPVEIQAHHDHKLYTPDLPASLVANWQMDG